MNMIKACLMLCCFTLVAQFILPPVSSAKLYTWTDRKGIVRRTYYPPPADQVWKDRPAAQNEAVRQPARQNQVELYVTSWCPYCKKAIQYFESRGIAFTAYDIEKDKQAAARKSRLDGQGGVPFAVINGTPVHGFSPEMYSKALNE